ncbi:Uu.00g008940.m01.CDS01 [Anthostomella pinea]|uniref:Uu.00g008940.m01.CDS01 n=1 Tax=Anthostomella pinea TaxID=933095 RepID=A0AAI8VXX7_9PEZI|nr:Uu.00g008940.m01.CDS01 [Anthostomella pinea]
MAATSNNIITLRRHDLDNLRTFLTGLVTVHHTSLAYGGVGSWKVKSACFAGNSPVLMGFNIFDQSFFMGMFFWISGRVSAQSLSKTSPSAFIKSKLLRLGAPALVYSYAIDPMMRAAMLTSWNLESLRASVIASWTTPHGLRGPVWYIGTMLAFDVTAAIATKIGWTTTTKGDKERSRIYGLLCRYGWIGVAASSFLIRLWYPVGKTIPILSLQPAFLSQYVYSYLLGAVSYKEQQPRIYAPFETMDASVDRTPGRTEKESTQSTRSQDGLMLTPALVISLSTMLLIFLPGLLISPDSWLDWTIKHFPGGWNWTALIYAIWNEFSFAVTAPALMAYFQRHYSQATKSSPFSARASYAAFLLHTPVIIGMTVLVDRLLCPQGTAPAWMNSGVWQMLGPVAMTLGAGLLSAYASFEIAGKALSWIPGLKNII